MNRYRKMKSLIAPLFALQAFKTFPPERAIVNSWLRAI